MIFDDTTSVSNYSKSYWVASPGAHVLSVGVLFGPGSVRGGNACCCNGGFFQSNGYWSARDYAVRPVVSLKSNITTKQLQVQSGLEEKNWSTSSGNNESTESLDSSKAISE